MVKHAFTSVLLLILFLTSCSHEPNPFLLFQKKEEVDTIAYICETLNDLPKDELEQQLPFWIDWNHQNKYGQTMLMLLSACNDNRTLFEKYIQHGADSNKTDYNGWNALFYSVVFQNDISIIKFLIEHGIDTNHIDKAGLSVLDYALIYNHDISVIKTLVNSSHLLNRETKDIGLSSLDSIIFNNPVMRSNLSISRKDLEIHKFYNWTPLMLASIFQADKKIIHFFLDKGFSVHETDSRSITPLFLAAEYQNAPEIVKTLLNAGSDLNHIDKYGRNALIASVSNRCNKQITNLLLAEGFDINYTDSSGKTALMRAVAQPESYEIVQELVERGADVNVQDKSGKTVLMHAVHNKDLFLYFLKNGADINIRDNEQQHSLHYAVRNKELFYYLLENPHLYSVTSKELQEALSRASNKTISSLIIDNNGVRKTTEYIYSYGQVDNFLLDLWYKIYTNKVLKNYTPRLYFIKKGNKYHYWKDKLIYYHKTDKFSSTSDFYLIIATTDWFNSLRNRAIKSTKIEDIPVDMIYTDTQNIILKSFINSFKERSPENSGFYSSADFTEEIRIKMLLGISTIAVYWPNLYELSLLQKDKHILFPEYNNTEEYPYEKIKNWGGLYNEDGEIILRFQKDNYGIIDTLVHEFGHRFDDKLLTKAYREPLEMHYTDMKNSSTGVFITDYAKKNFKEYFAENFAEYTLNPDKLKEVDEFVYTLFNKMSKNTRNNYFNN